MQILVDGSFPHCDNLLAKADSRPAASWHLPTLSRIAYVPLNRKSLGLLSLEQVPNVSIKAIRDVHFLSLEFASLM